jgi:hypothetical protein
MNKAFVPSYAITDHEIRDYLGLEVDVFFGIFLTESSVNFPFPDYVENLLFATCSWAYHVE